MAQWRRSCTGLNRVVRQSYGHSRGSSVRGTAAITRVPLHKRNDLCCALLQQRLSLSSSSSNNTRSEGGVQKKGQPSSECAQHLHQQDGGRHHSHQQEGQYHRLLWGLGGLGVGLAIGLGVVKNASAQGGITARSRGRDQPLSRYSIADAAELAAGSVVNITVQMRDTFFTSSVSMGSGFVLTSDGIIVTNAHVVAGAVKANVVVTLSTGEKLPGKVLALDGQSDVALIKVDTKRPLPPLKVGKSSLLRAGEWVVALGSPHRLTNSVSAGIVSAVARPGSELGMASRTEYIQTDTAINLGNSGGPLINLDGEVIGINTMKLQSADGISFSIPIDVAGEIIQQLQEKGRVIRPYIGIKMATVDRGVYDPDFQQQQNNGPERSVMIVHVAPGSPADKAGLKDGDLIIEFDGQHCTENKDVLHRIGYKVGRPIEVVVSRPHARRLLKMTLVSEPGGPP